MDRIHESLMREFGYDDRDPIEKERDGGISMTNRYPEEETSTCFCGKYNYNDYTPEHRAIHALESELQKDFFTRLYDTLMKADSVEMRRFSDGKSLVLIHDGRVTHRGVDDSLNTALTIAWNKMRIMRGEE